jgi:hypothetical protein
MTMTLRDSNKKRYFDMLRNDLRPAIRSNQGGILLEVALVLHDIPPPVLDHPSCSADLAPSDFHLIESPKRAPGGRRFTDDDEVKEAMHDWLRTGTKLFPGGMKSLWTAEQRDRRRKTMQKSDTVVTFHTKFICEKEESMRKLSESYSYVYCNLYRLLSTELYVITEVLKRVTLFFQITSLLPRES